MIYMNHRKSDEADALILARIGRFDPELLYPIQHGSEKQPTRPDPDQIARHPGAAACHYHLQCPRHAQESRDQNPIA